MFTSPYPPYDPTDTSGFSYSTVVKRWPVILTSIIDYLYRVNQNEEGTRLEESKRIIERIARLKYHLGRDHVLEEIPEDGEGLVELYNQELRLLQGQLKNTWFTAPWLFAECYLYRMIRCFFAQTTLWKEYDPFAGQKLDTFKQSGAAIYQIATTMHELEAKKGALDEGKLAVLFKEMIQMCLWGNATDLSLLTHMTAEDIAHLQTVGKEAQVARSEFILKDDQDAVWKHLSSLRDARVDFVLDNAGFELFTDLVFADFLVTYTPYVKEVVFHPKLIPWFVSDVTPPDFESTIESLLDPAFFESIASAVDSSVKDKEQAREHLKSLATRWQAYVVDGTFKLSVPRSTSLGASHQATDFWTTPYPYWDMKDRSPSTWKSLRDSGLVVFKGDLNFRKLTGDVKWPAWTSFEDAIGPLAHSFPILSLRTNKADVVVGVPKDVAEKLQKDQGNEWRVNGKYALVSFLGA